MGLTSRDSSLRDDREPTGAAHPGTPPSRAHCAFPGQMQHQSQAASCSLPLVGHSFWGGGWWGGRPGSSVFGHLSCVQETDAPLEPWSSHVGRAGACSRAHGGLQPSTSSRSLQDRSLGGVVHSARSKFCQDPEGDWTLLDFPLWPQVGTWPGHGAVDPSRRTREPQGPQTAERSYWWVISVPAAATAQAFWHRVYRPHLGHFLHGCDQLHPPFASLSAW